MAIIGKFEVTELHPFPPGANPMHEDVFHMGTELSSDVMMLHAHHPSQLGNYFILVHIPTGMRIMIEPPKEATP
jgi:hypothetical protein